MEIWKEFEANELTHSAAHYLMAIHALLNDKGYCRASDVSKELGIARSSASIGIQMLRTKGYLKEDDNKFLQLTQEGKSLAEEIIGKKVILKRFFQDILKVKAHQAEVDTCKIEHLISSETGAGLLGFIRFMSSEEPLVKKTLQKFWQLQTRESCPGLENCPVCETTCLRELMPAKLKVVK
ncbi:MAG: metal-dependent transcriptional regulator [Deltaproteobacteria bacterium]|nr:metal-dependent transcriptional regulator [Deltaproteobacteria bacterium]